LVSGDLVKNGTVVVYEFHLSKMKQRQFGSLRAFVRR
jgi:hypothetical protein